MEKLQTGGKGASSTDFCRTGITAANICEEVSHFNSAHFVTGRLNHGRGRRRKRNHYFSNMTATISNRMQWRFKSSIDLLCVCKKLLLIKGMVSQRSAHMERNELRAAIAAECGTSLLPGTVAGRFLSVLQSVFICYLWCRMVSAANGH